MAAPQGQVSLGMTALVANTPKTVVRPKAPTNQRPKVLGYPPISGAKAPTGFHVYIGAELHEPGGHRRRHPERLPG
jgi:hypothetical protein